MEWGKSRGWDCATAVFQILKMQKALETLLVLMLFQTKTQKSCRGCWDNLWHSWSLPGAKLVLAQALPCQAVQGYWFTETECYLLWNPLKGLLTSFFLTNQCSPFNVGFVMNAGKIVCNYQRNWFFRFPCVCVQHNLSPCLLKKGCRWSWSSLNHVVFQTSPSSSAWNHTFE